MTKFDFHRFHVRNNFEQPYGYYEDEATPKSRSKCFWTLQNSSPGEIAACEC